MILAVNNRTDDKNIRKYRVEFVARVEPHPLDKAFYFDCKSEGRLWVVSRAGRYHRAIKTSSVVPLSNVNKKKTYFFF